MSRLILDSNQHILAERRPALAQIQAQKAPDQLSSSALAASITKKASTQTYFTIRYLVDPQLVDDAYRAYAYYRWVDDTLDQGQLAKAERLDFLARQKEIIERCYQGEWPEGLTPEEQLVVELIHNDQEENSGLRTYIDQMMAVMVFDANRKNRLISQVELVEYTQSLATAVTEAMHYFIGHHDVSPKDETRYLAVTAAHITHMLRDTIEDAAAGYYNIPSDILKTHAISPTNVNHDAYRAWVHSQVKLARSYFATGRSYMDRVENPRCRLAGYAYIVRFEVVLKAIERDSYRLRPAYPERKSKRAALKMGLAALSRLIISSLPSSQATSHSARPSAEVGR